MNKRQELNEIDKVLLEETTGKLTEEELKEMGYEGNEIITKEKIEIYKHQFPELTVDELDKMLSLTIKKDRISKIITFLGMLTAYKNNLKSIFLLMPQAAQVRVIYLLRLLNCSPLQMLSFLDIVLQRLFSTNTENI